MSTEAVPAYSPAVLHYIKAVGNGTLPLDKTQLAELPPDLARILAVQQEDVLSATAMGRLLGKRPKEIPSKVDMSQLLEYFSTAELDAEGPLIGNVLTAPLPSYFINSSHNTYLTGNQLYGSASTEVYKDVLRRGCRSIEIDVWDGKTGSSERAETDKTGSTDHAADKFADRLSDEMKLQAEPRVLHGHTLTREVPFRKVCEAIAEAAFETSDLPVIVSLEVHAHADQQETMVQIMRQAWQGLLAEQPSTECAQLPSPSDLRRKILVKVKGKALATPEDPLSGLEKIQTAESKSSSDEDESRATKHDTPKPSKIIDSLSALGIYTCAYHFKKLDCPEANLPTHVFSLSERKVMTVHETDSGGLFSHNRGYLMRAFPAGTRVTSTNLDPAVFWRKGIQMVALNWQKFDAGVMQNRAMFSGSDGWVLKPPGYRCLFRGSDADKISESCFDRDQRTPQRFSLDLDIQILAAQQLPPAKHPYVKCELHVETPQERKGERIENGGRSKDGEHKRRTKVSKTLDFGSELLNFPNIRELVPELSFIRFKVMDDVLGPDELVAWGCIRLDRLCTGIRFLHLLDTHGAKTDAVLLLKVEKALHESPKIIS